MCRHMQHGWGEKRALGREQGGNAPSIVGVWWKGVQDGRKNKSVEVHAEPAESRARRPVASTSLTSRQYASF